MDEKPVDPVIFTWTIKIGTAIITFMTGIIVYLHRKIHAMDKSFAVNEQILLGIQATVNKIKTDQDTTMNMFHKQQTMYNKTELQRKELAEMVISQSEVIEDLRKVRKMGS